MSLPAYSNRKRVFKLQSLQDVDNRLSKYAKISTSTLKLSIEDPISTLRKIVKTDISIKNLVMSEETGVYEQNEQFKIARLCDENDINAHFVWDQSLIEKRSFFQHILPAQKRDAYNASKVTKDLIFNGKEMLLLRQHCPKRAMSLMKKFETKFNQKPSAVAYKSITGPIINSFPLPTELEKSTRDLYSDLPASFFTDTSLMSVSDTIDHLISTNELEHFSPVHSVSNSVSGFLDAKTAMSPHSKNLKIENAEDKIKADSIDYPLFGGETAGITRLHDYLWSTNALAKYKTERNRSIGNFFSSKFAVWIHSGNISPRTIVHEVAKYEQERVQNAGTYWLIFELMWREFALYQVMTVGPELFSYGGVYNDTRKWSKFGEYPVNNHEKGIGKLTLDAWKNGKTGYPIVDAWMRELKSTGWMSNRGRQNVASFLIYNLRNDWRLGAEWFEHQLIDHSVGPNYVNWNLAAGIGWNNESRVFNVIKQSKQYESDGKYVKKWCPELEKVPLEFIHTPWDWDGIQELPNARVYANPVISKNTFKYERLNFKQMEAPQVVKKKYGDKNRNKGGKKFRGDAVLGSAAEVKF